MRRTIFTFKTRRGGERSQLHIFRYNHLANCDWKKQLPGDLSDSSSSVQHLEGQWCWVSSRTSQSRCRPWTSRHISDAAGQGESSPPTAPTWFELTSQFTRARHVPSQLLEWAVKFHLHCCETWPRYKTKLIHLCSCKQFQFLGLLCPGLFLPFPLIYQSPCIYDFLHFFIYVRASLYSMSSNDTLIKKKFLSLREVYFSLLLPKKNAVFAPTVNN